MTSVQLLLAFHIYWPMLGWLVAAAAPLLIHLLTRRRYQEMPWAAMEHLLAAVRRRARRVRFEQWLLLLVRTLLIVLLVVAVAEPYFERTSAGGPSAGRIHRVLVVDASYSMTAQAADKTCFQQAKELARQIVDQSRQGDALSLVLLAAPPQAVVGRPALEPSQILTEIDALRPAHTGADLPATIALVERLVQSAGREDTGLAGHEVYFLTDLQRVDFGGGLSEAAQAELRRRAEQLARRARLVVVDLGRSLPPNAAVTSLRVLEPLASLGRTVSVEAAVRNFGSQALNSRPVELLVDGRAASRQTIDLAPGDERSVLFSWRFDTPGEHCLEVRTGPDPLQVDNHRWLSVPVPEAIRGLCIDGQPAGEPLGGATGHLALALSPADEPGDVSPVRVEVAGETALTERPLSTYDVVFLCRVAQFTAREARLLRNHLDHGGSLVFFLGEGVLADRYNQQLAAPGSARILPARIGRVIDQPQFRIDPLGYDHPMVRSFRGEGRASLLTAPVLKHFELELPPDSLAQVVLALPNGNPVIVEEALGRGRVVLVATSADPSWTGLPLWPSFVPLVQEMLAYCAAGWQRQRNLTVGEVLQGTVPARARELPVEVEDPAERRHSVRTQTEGNFATFSDDQTMLSGLYRARLGPEGEGRETRYYAFNLDTRQSDLARLDQEELGARVWQGVDFELVSTWQGGPAESAAPLVSRARLPAQLLYVVLGMLFAELFLGWRFGYHTP